MPSARPSAERGLLGLHAGLMFDGAAPSPAWSRHGRGFERSAEGMTDVVNVRSKRFFWIFLGPFGALFVTFFVFPIGYAFYDSLFIERIGVAHFVGLANYAVALRDTAFWAGFIRVIVYGVIDIAIIIVLALTLALILDSPMFKRWTTAFRLIYFIPYAVPGVIASIMWGFLYSPQLDALLRLPTVVGGHAVNPLAPGGLLFAIVNISVWGATGYIMMLYVAGLSSIPHELYDAASIDGCSEWQLARLIKLPMIRPTIVLTTVLAIIGALQLFGEPEVLSSLTTISTTYTPNLDIYNTAFSYLDIPFSATLAMILGVITVTGSVVFLRTVNRADAMRRPG